MRPRTRPFGILLGVCLGAAIVGAAACTMDPVGAAQEAAYEEQPDLGIEGYENTEFHRPGQDCLACHGPRGSAKAKFDIAGTVFWGTCLDPEAGPEKCVRTGVSGAEVRMLDRDDRQRCVRTNCVGNFFVREGLWSSVSNEPRPHFPMLASVFKQVAEGAQIEQVMSGHINRWGSCNACHRTSPYWNSAGQIYLTAKNDQIPASASTESESCRSNPVATDESERDCVIVK